MTDELDDDVTTALARHGQSTAELAEAMRTVAHQASAETILNAVLVRELTRLKLIDGASLRAEALRHAEGIAPEVFEILRSMLDQGNPPLSRPKLSVVRNESDDRTE